MKHFHDPRLVHLRGAFRLILGCLVFCAMVPSSYSQEGDEEDLRAEVDEQAQRLDDLESQLLDYEEAADLFGHALGTIEIHGFLAQGFMKSNANNYLTDSSDGSFAFNEMGINFAMDLGERTRTGVQLFARDLGPVGNNVVTVDWAVFDYRYDDLLGLRFGKVKMPHGLYNETRDIDFLRNSILLPASVYNETFRDTMAGLWGVGLYGGGADDDLGGLEYQVQVGTTPLTANGSVARAIEDSLAIEVDELEMDTTWAASLRWRTPIDGLLLSATTLETEITARGDLTEDLGGPVVAGTPLRYELSDTRYSVLSAEYTWDDLIVAAEYWTSTLNLDVDAQIGPGSVSVEDSKIHQEGYYLGASRRFRDWFELGAYYSVYYPNSDDKSGDGQVAAGDPAYRAWSKDFALTLRFDIDDAWVFKLEGHRIDGVAGLYTVDNPEGFSRNWNLFLAKLSVSF